MYLDLSTANTQRWNCWIKEYAPVASNCCPRLAIHTAPARTSVLLDHTPANVLRLRGDAASLSSCPLLTAEVLITYLITYQVVIQASRGSYSWSVFMLWCRSL